MEPAAAAEDAVAGLGPRVRALRQARRWTLAQLAAASGLSEAHVSRLESGSRQPSLATALAVASGLGVPLAELLGHEEVDRSVVLRGGAAPVFESFGVRLQPLTPSAGQQVLQAIKLTIPPGHDGGERRAHPGEEWLYVLSGRLRLVLGEATHVLEAGDAANFDGSVPHLLVGEGVEAELLVVATAPGRQVLVLPEAHRGRR